MGRSGSAVWAIIILLLMAALVGCSSSSTKTTPFPVPASIILSPVDKVSIDLGGIQTFTASARNKNGVTITVPISFQTSNATVLTIANNGDACAGTWDSVSLPQVCTPGPVGVAEVTATAKGVSSPPTTVYVHQHIQSITVDPLTPPPSSCLSKDQTFDFAATAYSLGAGNQLVDITPTVGPFTWQALNPNVVLLSTTASGLLAGQVQATARVPGLTQIFASVSSVNSLPMDFTTCAVQSIALQVTGAGGNSFTVAKGGSKGITPTVVDSLGTTITGVTLTWSSSHPATAAVSSSGNVTTTEPGGSTIIASCAPPGCNIGFTPTLAIYPVDVITATVTGTPSNPTAYVASKACGTTDGCVSGLVPITAPTNQLGRAINLPATPNSLVFSRDGKKAYLGTDLGLLGTRGLMVFDPAASTVAQHLSVTGRVLAVSPDGKKVIVSDTIITPNQVFILDTTSSSILALAIPGATAADFSPDSLKAFILAGSALYVYSTVDALQTIPLGAPATDVSFLANGMFGYMIGGDPAGISFVATCEDPTNFTIGSVTALGAALLQALPDGKTILALAPPNIETITADISGTPPPSAIGCPMPLGFLTVTNTLNPPVNLGQGNFAPTQLIISPDGLRAYVFTSDLGSVLVFDIGSQTTSPLPLAGNAVPIQASLNAAGTLLYVAASDGMVHVVDTVVDSDVQQVSFPQSPSPPQGGLCTGVTFPLQAVASITAASQSGPNTTYTYTLTSGPALQVGTSIVIAGMEDAGNNGTFVIDALGTGTFTVANASGVTASGQNGTGTGAGPATCDPDLIAVRP